jgi:hypothetical protein
LLERAALLWVVEDRQEGVIRAERAGAGVDCIVIDEGVSDPVKRRHGHALIEVVEHAGGWEAMALEDWKESAGEQRFARESEFGVA